MRPNRVPCAVPAAGTGMPSAPDGAPGRPARSKPAKNSAHSSGTDEGSVRYRWYNSSMYGALARWTKSRRLDMRSLQASPSPGTPDRLQGRESVAPARYHGRPLAPERAQAEQQPCEHVDAVAQVLDAQVLVGGVLVVVVVGDREHDDRRSERALERRQRQAAAQHRRHEHRPAEGNLHAA